MAEFRYRALTAKGDLVNGSIEAFDVAEVARRIEFLGLTPIEMREGASAGARPWWAWEGLSRPTPKPTDVTMFTRDLALVLSAGVRLDSGLDLLAADASLGRLRPAVVAIRSGVMAGQPFATALARHGSLFPPVYLALVRVGEATGTLTGVLQAVADERVRNAALRRKVVDALSYPAFVLTAAVLVVLFFLGFVLPQFGGVLRDAGAKVDPVVSTLLTVSDAARGNAGALALGAAAVVVAAWLALRRPAARASLMSAVTGWPGIRGFASSYRAALFCRTLGVLLSSGVGLSVALRMLSDTMATTGGAALWPRIAERVRQGGKLADAVEEGRALPPVAIRMLRLGEETGQLSSLALKAAELFEAKLERGLDKAVGIIGPAAIVVISLLVGGLIVSIMTSLLSITQLVN